jgi:putative endonuclease
MANREDEKSHYVYMVCCADNTLYTGYTDDLEKRLRAHNEGKGARYTRGRTPVRLCYWAAYSSKQEAMRAEWQMKRLTRRQKLALIRKGME